MNKLKRRYISESVYDQVIAWAEREYQENNTRAINDKPLHKSFPCALEKYIKFIKYPKKILFHQD